ncbi:MAG: ornithine carbamoyltransferase, partial [candidate division WOR-3 bacterium]
ASMGQEAEAEMRKQIFKNYKVDSELLKLAPSHVAVLHCLPAHRGEEITDEVLDGPHSIVLDQAENRLHSEKAIIIKLFRNVY